MNERFNIDIRVETEVLKINREKKEVELRNLKTKETYIESYDKLILSPGAEPIKPPIPGINSERVFVLRTIPDSDKIKKIVTETKPKHAVVVGGGFIGLEMAENLHHAGVNVSIVEMSD